MLARILWDFVKQGDLTVIGPGGKTHRFGSAGTEPAVTIRLHDRSLEIKFLLNPRLYVGEAYMDGTLTVEQGTIYDFLDLVSQNLRENPINRLDAWTTRVRMLWRNIQQANPLGRAQKNVAHHYDLSGALYEMFLDADRQYSCGYFTSPRVSLDEAQEAKKRHLASKLILEPGQRVLDIGSGWGGLGIYLARTAGVDVTGVTLSTEQHVASEERAAGAGLSDHVHFLLQDYRDVTGTFDRIVSVGMFEHVGVPHYEEFFRKIYDLLPDDGIALLHTIADRNPPATTNPWIRKYIFPGGYCPSLSEVLCTIERCGLWVTDIEILRLHYAETLRHWRERFLTNWDRVAGLHDERFCRMWEFYLSASEVWFRHMGQMVAQIQLAKTVDAVPLTRDYMRDWEEAHTDVEPTAPRRMTSVG